jgi:hypothetical protein
MPGVRPLYVVGGEVMRRGLLALVVLFAISPLARAQDADAPEAQPFSISSLHTAFAMQADFEGEYRIYPDRIELKVTKANIRVSEHCPYKGRRLLSAVKFGLATSTANGGWKIAHVGQEFLLEQVMGPGDRHSLGARQAYIPKDDSIDLTKHWLVVQMEDTVLDVPEEKRRKGYAFAHSWRDIFRRAK